MKKLSLFALAAAGLFFAACSSDDAISEEKANKWNQGEDGYMALSINLPTTPTTRAANDVYDDGLAAEYKVTDAGLLLFSGNDEASATLMYAQPLTLPFPDTDEDAEGAAPSADNITTAYQAVAKVSGTKVGNNIYALVVLNYKNVVNIADGSATIVPAGTKVTDLASIQSAAANIVAGNARFTNKGSNETSDYFFMTNALLQVLGADQTATEPTKATAAPAPGDIQTLVKIDETKIYPTEEEAKANPAADIYVERAVAKATLNYDASAAGTIQGNVTGQAALNVTGVEWAIDNIEPASFIVRNPGDNGYIAYSSEAFGADNHYRFVGDKAMGITARLHNYYVPVYRHYWCVDPVYSLNATKTLDTDVEGTDYRTAAQAMLPAPKYIAAGTDPLYCNENTFDVEHQRYENTTRAVIKVTTDGGEFYTVNGGQERFTEADAKSYLVTDIVESSEFQAKVKKALRPTHTYTFKAASIVPEYEVDEATAQVKVKSITLGADITAADFYMTAADITADSEAPADAVAIESLSFADEISAANGNWTVLKYKDGVMYYEARFEHFANTYYEKANGTKTAAAAFAAGDLAPWNFWEAAGKKPTATTAYPAGTKTAEENYLGRYGMVRNNWYDVTVSAFKKLGSPVDPTGKIDKPKTPDDNVEEYISIKIMVLSWAKRTQQWIL